MITGTYKAPRRRDPLDRLMEAARTRDDLVAEFAAESPGWAYAFVSRPVMLDSGTDDNGVALSDPTYRSAYEGKPCCVVTHGAAGDGWDISLYASGAAFGGDDDGNGMLEPIAFVADAEGDYPNAALDRCAALLSIPEGQRERERIERAVRDGEAAFWAEVAEHFPEIKTGDVDPVESVRQTQTWTRAVYQWLRDNAPEKDA